MEAIKPYVFPVICCLVFSMNACSSNAKRRLVGEYSNHHQGKIRLNADSTFVFDDVEKFGSVSQFKSRVNVEISGKWEKRNNQLLLHCLNYNGIGKNDSIANCLGFSWELQLEIRKNGICIIPAGVMDTTGFFFEKE